MAVSPVSPARWAAYRILLRVEREDAFATDLLHSSLSRGLEQRDLALLEELTLGVLRRRGELDWLLSQVSGRSLEKLDLEVRIALWLGAYQLRRLDRIPARAAVSESVAIVKRARKASAAGFVNAVLRKLAGAAALIEPPVSDWAVPAWILERWRRHYGDATAERLAAASLEAPPTYLRLNVRYDLDETLRLLAAEGVETAPTELPFCREVRSGNPARTECFRQGRIRIQDIGSQRIVPLLGLEPGNSFLDLCAAPGGKTYQALEQRGDEGLAVACDLHHHRLLAARRLATLPVDMAVLDAARPLPFSITFDRILVDAPCSGTGTLARNPEIKWKLRPADLADLAARQKAILAQALALLAPHGRLVYSTCSLEPEENQEVIDAVVDSRFVKREVRQWLPGSHPGEGFFACVISRRP
jgi:16S rRNA (cytosine967-C5)-methyltransferase